LIVGVGRARRKSDFPDRAVGGRRRRDVTFETTTTTMASAMTSTSAFTPTTAGLKARRANKNFSRSTVRVVRARRGEATTDDDGANDDAIGEG
jgi:biotin synthase-related radical SAM superfamily protein